MGAKPIAVVTGGSRGIGRAVVKRLANDGHLVFFTCRKVTAEVSSFASTIGGVAVELDLACPGDPARLFATVLEEAGAPTVVVHNAAVENALHDVVDVTEEELVQLVDGNLKGGFRVLQLAARHVVDAGRIVTISSLDTKTASRGTGLYGATKAALEYVTASIAHEVGERGITANTVSPGAVDTDRLRSVRSDAELVGAANATPLGRLGVPGDIAAVVSVLVSADAAWLTAQNIRATGGLG